MKAIRKVEMTVSLDGGIRVIEKERYTEWKEGWKKLKKILNEVQKRNKTTKFGREEASNWNAKAI